MFMSKNWKFVGVMEGMGFILFLSIIKKDIIINVFILKFLNYGLV